MNTLGNTDQVSIPGGAPSAYPPFWGTYRGASPPCSILRLAAVASFWLFALAGSAAAQDKFPAKPVQLIAPFSTGTAVDFLARVFAEKLTPKLGQPVVVQNRPGASGTIAAESVAKAAPDGHTLLIINSQHSTNPALYDKLPYETLRDFAGIAMVAQAPSVIVVSPALGVRTLKEFVALAKKQPGRINYATSGVGTNTHLGGAFFTGRAAIELVAVPYKGMEMIADMISGRIEAMFVPLPAVLAHVKDGKLVALAVTSREPLRTPIELQSVESAADLPGFEYVTYYGFLAPAKVSRRIVEQLSQEIRETAQDMEWFVASLNQGMPFASAMRLPITRPAPLLISFKNDSSSAGSCWPSASIMKSTEKRLFKNQSKPFLRAAPLP